MESLWLGEGLDAGILGISIAIYSEESLGTEQAAVGWIDQVVEEMSEGRSERNLNVS